MRATSYKQEIIGSRLIWIDLFFTFSSGDRQLSRLHNKLSVDSTTTFLLLRCLHQCKEREVTVSLILYHTPYNTHTCFMFINKVMHLCTCQMNYVNLKESIIYRYLSFQQLLDYDSYYATDYRLTLME